MGHVLLHVYIYSCAYCIGYGFEGNIWCLVIMKNIMDVNVVVFNIGLNIAFFLPLICTCCWLETSPSLLTDIPRVEPAPIYPTYWCLM